MPKRSWWATSMADQSSQLLNFSSKIGGYATPLGLSPAQVTSAQGLCQACIDAYNFTETCRMTMQAVTQWRDLVCYGEPTGSTIPSPPVFPVGTVPAAKLGVITQFFNLRDQIVANSGYTMAMGEDLGIVGAEVAPLTPLDVAPSLKTSISMGNTVNVTGSMQGMDAMRVEYAPKGGNFSTVAFLTKTPGGFLIAPTNPNQPETGVIRAVFIKKNAEFGNFSPSYPVTVS